MHQPGNQIVDICRPTQQSYISLFIVLATYFGRS